MEILAIIPARGGSKGIKNKNLQKICGLSLLGRSIKNASKSESISRIIVSTDSAEIAEEARLHQAEVPFMRPAELSGDRAETIHAFLHALSWLKENENYVPDAVMCLQCTSPFVTKNDLNKSINIYTQKKAQAVFSVCETPHHPIKMGKIDSHGRWQHLLGEPAQTCRQKLEKVYQHNGAIYIVDSKTLLSKKTWFPEKTIPYVMDRDRSIDIDTKQDLNYLEFLLENNKYKDLYIP